MKYLKNRVKAGEVLYGIFVNLGSSLTAEIIGSAGCDWALIDLEHGAGDEREVLFRSRPWNCEMSDLLTVKDLQVGKIGPIGDICYQFATKPGRAEG